MAEPAPTPARRPLWIVAGLLPLAAAALWGAAALTWEHSARGRPGTDLTVTVDITGGEVAPALVPLAVLAVAAVAGTLALGGVWRRLLGVVVALLGLVPVFEGVVDGTEFAGRALAVAGGALMLAAGVVLVLRGHRAPRLGGRYRSPGAVKEAARDEEDLWRALSEGEDPTR
ncbi:Trp biosynthesis-associated membrane protein [Actinokineospora terrae]|uniref:Trp biosynthesis-associated membrane protein n=1 Tax=Actinokineospora terrae TaxID=155974 RepID=UPI000B82152C|nr:Trp biosynthesis-associated membrane protein [Actinokineospora terrae]